MDETLPEAMAAEYAAAQGLRDRNFRGISLMKTAPSQDHTQIGIL